MSERRRIGMRVLKKALAALACASALILGGSIQALDAPVGQTVDLFNGRDLAGWVNVNCAPETWSVRDGMIYCTGNPRGYLRTVDMYENYVLELDWRHLKPKANAGLFVHANALPAVGAPYPKSVEVQIQDGDHGSVFAIRGATLTPLTNAKNKRAMPTEDRNHPASSGEWNHYKLTARDGALDLEVNGKLVTRAKDVSQVKGYVCLEAELGEVYFKNIKLTPMPSNNPPADKVAQADKGLRTIFDGLDFHGWKLAKGSEGHWVAKDGVILYDGKSEAAVKEKDLWSEKPYRNFTLVVDWRLPRKAVMTPRPTFSPNGDRHPEAKKEILDAGDSGIYLRGSTKAQLNIWSQPMGSGQVFGYATDQKQPADVRTALIPRKHADNPPGQWNRFEATMKGDRLTVLLNGETIIENALLPGIPPSGPIALQHHTDPVEFRNLYIKEND